MSYTIGVDIGATKTNFVLLKDLRVIKAKRTVTLKTKKKLIEAVEENIQKLISDINKSKILGIGIGVTGPLNEKRNLMLNPPNQKYLKLCPLAKIIENDLRKNFKLKTIMDNDVNCFTLGEALLGAGKEVKTVFGVTLGTGVGGGIVINKKLYRGNFGSAGEVGHMTIKYDGHKCSCGNIGCFEEYSSGRFFKRKGVDPKELAKIARNGDEKALEVFKEYGKYLGIGLSNTINLLDPEMIVLGGGIANTHSLFIKETKKEMKQRITSPIARKNLKIKKTRLGGLATAIGAALLCQKK